MEAGDRVALRCEVGSHPPAAAAAAVLHAITGTVNLAGGDGAAGPIFLSEIRAEDTGLTKGFYFIFIVLCIGQVFGGHFVTSPPDLILSSPLHPLSEK